MRVVLFQSVSNVGMAGEVVEVKPGFFRNYLEPRGYAMRESPGALRLLASKKKKIEQILLKEKSQAEEAQKTISAVTLSFKLKAGEKGRLFGSVTNRDIATALHERGIEVDRHRIEVPESIKSVGSHKVRVRLHPEVVAEVTVVVEAEMKAPEAVAAPAPAKGEAPAESEAKASPDAAPEAAPEKQTAPEETSPAG